VSLTFDINITSRMVHPVTALRHTPQVKHMTLHLLASSHRIIDV